MKKNAFTLVELLASLVILGIVATLAIQSYNVLVVNNDKDKYEYYYKFITKGADLYLEARKYGMESGSCLVVDYSILKNKNYVKEEDLVCEGNLVLRKNKNKYEYDDSNLSCKTSNGKVIKQATTTSTTSCQVINY